MNDDYGEHPTQGESITTEVAIEQAMFLCGQFATQIVLADTKAAYILGGAAVLATIASFDSRVIAGLFDPTRSLVEHLVALLIIAMFGLLLGSVADSLIVTLPVFPRPKRRNLYYFVSVKHMSEDAYHQAFAGQTPHEIQRALTNQVHVLASITYNKFVHVRRSLYLLVGAFGLWIVIRLLQAF